MSDNQNSTDLTTQDGHELDRFQDPGIPAHKSRMADRDPKAAKRAEKQVVILFTISIIGTIGMLVAFFALPEDTSIAGIRTANLVIGLGLAFSLLGIGLAAVHWAKTLMSDHEHVDERHAQRSSDAVRAEAVQALTEGAQDSGIARRGVLKGAVVTALALFPLAIAVPLVAEVGGDWNVSKFRHTLWKPKMRLALDPSGRPIKAEDVTIGSAFHVIPDVPEEVRTSHEWISEKAKAIVLMVRLDPRDLKEAEDRKDWSYDGIVAYSKVCTHVGCPVALYEQQTHHLLCPCHQSTFDVADGAKVVFGPAKRPLPQLPITVDDEGYLIAQSDFLEPVGPSYWERLK
ncbi:ubiquinol-cytochrome c reductase iron-sulfur subunit [Oerskovia turbata]|nr:Rieske 2Fe-2S domain-containing protein [Oerskovia turbata]